MRSFRCILTIVSVLFACALRDAHASPELRRAAILTTIAEAAVASASLIQDRTDGAKTQEISWSATYTERDWSLRAEGSVRGEVIDFVMTGYLWGRDQESWLLTFSGLGKVGSESIGIHGRADWRYDREASDYRNIDFRQVVKFGENSVWGWVLGAETIIGGTIGAGGAVAGSAVATSGVALGAAPWIAAGGALAGSTALIGASAAAKSLLESDEPVPPPPAPEPPAAPAAGQELLPSEGTIFTAVSHDGRIMASGPGGTQILIGAFKLGTANGSIETL